MKAYSECQDFFKEQAGLGKSVDKTVVDKSAAVKTVEINLDEDDKSGGKNVEKSSDYQSFDDQVFRRILRTIN